MKTRQEENKNSLLKLADDDVSAAALLLLLFYCSVVVPVLYSTYCMYSYVAAASINKQEVSETRTIR